MTKLLVVDDDAGNRTFVVNTLMSEWPEGEILTAPNGKLGLEIAFAENPQLILLDWEMPEMDGLSMLKALRAHPASREIPVVMYTGIRTGSESLRLALEAGANEFLRKPVDPMEMIARIRSIILQKHYYQEKIKAEREKQELELKAKEREVMLRKNDLTSLTLILEQKDLFLKDLLQHLESFVQEEGNTDAAAPLRSIIRDLKSELESERNWEAMKVRMNGMHSGFLTRLVEKHPKLTPNELKLCSLLKLNLSSKETAAILHISVAGVEKRRYRLRKKLGLDSYAKIENYIHSFSTSSIPQ